MPSALRLLSLITIATLLVTGPSATASPDAPATPPPLWRHLEPFGIDASAPTSIVRFLTEGIPEAARRANLPREPVVRFVLFGEVMQIAVLQNIDAARAPLMRLAAADFSPGIQRILNEDSRTVAPSERDGFREQATGVLQYNAANALGLMGERAALPLIMRLRTEATNEVARLQLSLAAATLGATEVIPSMIDAARDGNRTEAFAAIQALEWLAGEDFDSHPQAPHQRRQASATKARQWWQRVESRGWMPDPAQIRQRREQPRIDPPLPPRPNTLRDHLRWASRFGLEAQVVAVLQRADQDPDQSRASRRFLGQLPGTQIAGLATVAQDPIEDLDIRTEAFRWLGHHNPDQATHLARRLRNDPDPEISTAARNWLQQR